MERRIGQKLPFIDQLPTTIRALCAVCSLAAISACSHGSPQETKIASSESGNIITLANEAKAAEIEKPTTVERSPLTIEQQAMAYAFDRFVFNLSREQGELGKPIQSAGNGGYHYIDTQIVDITKINNRDMVGLDIVSNRIPLTERYITARAIIEDYDVLTNTGPIWGSAVAESELKNFDLTISKSKTLTAADRANGLDFQGEVVIKFISRYKAVAMPSPADSLPKKPSQEYRLTWKDETTYSPVEFRGGKWQWPAQQAAPKWLVPTRMLIESKSLAQLLYNQKTPPGGYWFTR